MLDAVLPLLGQRLRVDVGSLGTVAEAGRDLDDDYQSLWR